MALFVRVYRRYAESIDAIRRYTISAYLDDLSKLAVAMMKAQ